MAAEPRVAARVLLVDDDLDVLGANARFLRVSGHEVLVAESAASALARLEADGIDLVVTDLRMPDLDGLAFARRARESRPLLPIVFFSGFARVPDVVAAMKLGAIDFLEKPIEPDLLLEAIEGLILARPGTSTSGREAFVDADERTPLRLRVRAYEKHLIESAFRRHDGRVSDVLQALRINRRTLNDKMAKLGIRRQDLVADEAADGLASGTDLDPGPGPGPGPVAGLRSGFGPDLDSGSGSGSGDGVTNRESRSGSDEQKS